MTPSRFVQTNILLEQHHDNYVKSAMMGRLVQTGRSLFGQGRNLMGRAVKPFMSAPKPPALRPVVPPAAVRPPMPTAAAPAAAAASPSLLSRGFNAARWPMLGIGAGAGLGYHQGVNKAMDSMAPMYNQAINDFTNMPFAQRFLTGLAGAFAPNDAVNAALSAKRQNLQSDFWSDPFGYKGRLMDNLLASRGYRG